MGRFILRGVVTVGILLGLYGGGLYLSLASHAREDGGEYRIGDLPRDMYRTIRDLVTPADPDADDVASLTDPIVIDPAISGTAMPPVIEDRPGLPSEEARGRELFDAGKFRDAIREWEFAARRRWNSQIDDDLATARLFAVVVERFETAAERRRNAHSVLLLESGASMEGRVRSEDETSVTLEFDNGSTGTIGKSEIADRTDPDTDVDSAGFEDEYQARIAGVTTPSATAYLELARWCVGRDLLGHVTYLLERLRAADDPTDPVMARLLVDTYPDLSSWEQEEIAQVLKRHFQQVRAVHELLLRRMGVEPEVTDRPLAGAGTRPTRPSRVSRPPRAGIGDVFLDQADEAKAWVDEARKHYVKAMPDMPDRKMHREKALVLLKKARDRYDVMLDERDEAWLRRRLKEVYEMISGLNKDATIR